jgi:hypothetical protein
MILLRFGRPLRWASNAFATESRNSMVSLISDRPFSLVPFLLVIVNRVGAGLKML